MRGQTAREIRKFLKQSQNLDLSHKACEERGIRGEQIGEITVMRLIDGIHKEEQLPLMRFRNPEKNYYRQIKKKYVKDEI